ncbi:DUF4235 domain-containing protein [Algoriphagus namhaensis]
MKLSKNKYQLLSTVLPLAVAALAKSTLDKRYEASTGKPAPKNPETDEATFGQVLLYATITAAVGVSVKLLMRKFLANQWKRMDGELPKHLS